MSTEIIISEGGRLTLVVEEPKTDIVLSELPGLRGPAGEAGVDGADGAAGASAYQIAVANGFVGTEAEWLESLAAPGGGGGSTLLGRSQWNPVAETQLSFGASLSDVTEFAPITVTVPPSGELLAVFDGLIYAQTYANLTLAVRTGTTTLVAKRVGNGMGNSVLVNVSPQFVVAGLTPGESVTLKLSASCSAGTSRIIAGAGVGPADFLVHAL